MTDDQFPFVVRPESNEYEVLSFLVRNEGNRFRLSQIAEQTEIAETPLSKTVDRLVDRGLIEHSEERYYVDPTNAEDLRRRLESLDAAVRLHENAPDDAYTQQEWES